MSWIIGKKNKAPEWPDGADSLPVPPAYLKRIHGGPLDLELTLNLLEAYGIPHVSEYPNDGLFGKMIMGFPPAGIEVFVPETMLEDARNILAADEFLSEESRGANGDE